MKNLDSLKILIVDDHMLSRKLLSLQLISYGFKEESITMHSNPNDALIEMQTNDFDIIITDWDMPDINGLEFVQKCKKIEKTKTAYIMISAEAQSEKILFAINSGVTSYITKPVNQTDINEKIGKVILWLEGGHNE